MRDIAVVTGGSRGIGREVARILAETYDVVSLSRSMPDVGIPATRNIKCDITNPGEVAEAFCLAAQRGVLKILVNCAGVVEPKSVIETTLNEWECQIKTNLTGAFLCIKEFLRYNKAGGKIFNIASTAGTRPSPGWAAYGAAKAGLINFSQSLNEELRPYKVKVYCLVPGRCATGLRRKLAPDENQSKIMQPQEMAAVVRYLTENDGVLSGHPLVVKR